MVGAYHKYRQIVWYIICGVMTTGVNFLVYGLMTRIFGFGPWSSSIVGWVVSVLFAYIVNKYLVFVSDTKFDIREMLQFYSSRLLTGVLDFVLFYIFVHGFNQNDMIVKVIVNIVVILLNYIFGKLIFRRKEV